MKNLFLVFSIFFISLTIKSQSNDFSLCLYGGLNTNVGDLPVLLYIKNDGGTLKDAYATCPYWIVGPYGENANPEVQPTLAYFPVNISGLSFSGSKLTGTVSFNMIHPVKEESKLKKQINYTIDATVSGNKVNGNYTGTCVTTGYYTKTANIGSTLSGRYDPTYQSGDGAASMMLEIPYPDKPDVGLDNGTFALAVYVKMSGGNAISSVITKGGPSGTLYAPPAIEMIKMITTDGDYVETITRLDETAFAASKSQTATIAGGVYNAEVTANYKGIDYTYKMTAKIYGKNLLGSYELFNGATKIKGNNCVGHIGDGNVLYVTDTVSKIQLAGKIDSGFTPPYHIEPTDFEIRLKSAAFALFNDPILDGFKSNFNGGCYKGTGDKQYDNLSFQIYAGIENFLYINQTSTDAALKEKCLNYAKSASAMYIAKKTGPYKVSEYYKGMWWFSAWAGIGLADLYKETRDSIYLKELLIYANSLRITQRTTGTWTYVDEVDGWIGHSNERDDRSYDNRPLHCSEFLLFLGKIRKELGITSYTDVETNAYNWMVNNISRSDIWRDRRGVPVYAESHGPTQFLLYMLDYAPSYNQLKFDSVLIYIETNHIDWSHPVDGNNFKPCVTDYFPRWNLSDDSTSSTISTARMALVYLKLFQKTNNAVYLNKAKSLAYSVLARQNHTTGLISTNGKIFSNDNYTRLLYQDQHQYNGLRMDAVLLLNEYYKLYTSLGLTTCTNNQTITFPNPGAKQPTDASFTLNATASSGLPCSYYIAKGPATVSGNTVTLTGSTGVVEVIAYQLGNSTWCNAQNVSVFFAVGNVKPAAPSNLVGTALSKTDIQLIWVNNAIENSMVIERSTDGINWTIVDTIYSVTTFTDKNLLQGTTYNYRVRVYNEILNSDYSPISTTTTFSSDINIYFEPECETVPSLWQIVDDAAASNGKYLKSLSTVSPSQPGVNSIITINIPITQAGKYSFWVYGKATGGTNDSYYRKFPNDPQFYSASLITTGIWTWTKAVEIDLPIGMFTIQIANREKDALIDQFLLTTSTKTPTGKGTSYFNCGSELTKPTAPTSLTAIENLSQKVELTWTDNANNELGFYIERKEAGGSYLSIATLPANTTTYTDDLVTNGITYLYKLTAYNSIGYSDSSNIATIQVGNITSILSIETKEKIKIWPNPVIDNLTINIPDVFVKDIKSIDLYNSAGILVSQSSTINYGINTINMTSLSSGFYYVKVGVEILKIIKK